MSRRHGLALVLTGGLGIRATAPALASDPVHAAVRGVGPSRGSASYHEGFAGYNLQLAGYGPASSVSETTTFVVPRSRCGRAPRAIAPSVGAFVGKDNNTSAAALFVGCYDGKAHYWPELAVNGSIRNYPTKAAHAGDVIVLRLDTQRGGQVSVADETHKLKVSRASPPGGSVSFAWIGDGGWADSHDHLEGVPGFGRVTYSNTKVYGGSIEHLPASGQASAENRSSAGTVQIQTGPLFSNGTAFRSDFKHS
jgi:hypothetical protein